MTQVHIAIATMGKQENIDRLCIPLFWQSIDGIAASVYILSQIAPVTIPASWNAFTEYRSHALGCGGARQTMVDYYVATGLQANDVIVFLDDDIEVLAADWLSRLIAPLAGEYSIAGVEGRKLTDYMPAIETVNPDYVSGGWCATRGDVWLDGCRFDDRYKPNYWEDVDLCFQARERDKRVTCVGNVGLRHEETLKAGQDLLLARNRARFYAKWGLE